MSPILKKIVLAPVFPDEERTRMARILTPMLNALMVVVIVGGIATVVMFTQKTGTGAVIIGTFLVCVAARMFMNAGAVHAAGYFFVVGLGVDVILLVFFSGGLTSINAVYFVALVAVSGLLLGRKAVWLMTSGILAVSLVMVLLPIFGYTAPKIFPVPARSGWLMLAFALIVTSVTFTTALRLIDETLAQVRSELAERRQAEDALRLRENAGRAFSERLTALHTLVNELARTDTFDAFFRHAVECGKKKLGLERISIWLIGDDTTSLQGTFGTDEHGMLRDERTDRVSIVAQSEVLAIINGASDRFFLVDSPIYDDTGNVVGKGDHCGAALFDGERTVGIMFIDNFLTRQPFTDDDRNILLLYASSVGHLFSLKRASETLTAHALELKRSNQELEEFAYIASHDLKEPIRTVGSYAQLLERRYGEHLDDQAKAFIRSMAEGVKRMHALIDALLLYSRAGTGAPVFEPVDSDAMLKQCIEMMSLAIRESGAEIHAAPLPVVYGNSVQIRQVFQNLLSNALKFRSEHPVINVSAAREGDFWRITIADNGIGFEQEHAERIFLIFQRLHARDEYDGMGLGLAICKKIIARHGGTISAAGTPGQGAAFHFTLPALAAAAGKRN